jgi:hypothetical protein
MSEKTRRAKRANFGVLSAFVLLGLACAAPWTLAVDKIWVTDQADWNTPGAWNPSGVPGAGDNNYVGNGLTAKITADVPQTQELYVGGVSDNGQDIAGPGTLTQTGGTLTLRGGNAWLVVGQRGGTTGTYNLSSGKIDLNNDFMSVGQDGTGFLNVSGNGIVDVRGLIFGRWATPGNGTGTLTGNGAILTHENGFTVAQQGIGTFTQSGGTVTVPESGDGNQWMYIGRDGGTGVYNMSAGTLNSGQRIQLGQSRTSKGTFNLTGGAVTVGHNMSVGDAGTGILDVSGGTLTVNDEGLIIGAWRDVGDAANPPNPPNAGGNGLLKVSGTGVINANNLRIARGDPSQANGGIYNTGVVQQTGGTVTVTNEVTVGSRNVLSNGTYNISGGSLSANIIRVAAGGTGTMNVSGNAAVNATQAFMVGTNDAAIGTGTGTQTGGTVHSGGWVSIGTDAAATGTYTLSGGSLIADGDFNVSDNGGSAGTLNLSGSGIAQGNAVFLGKQANTTAIVMQTGGTMKVGGGNLNIATNATAVGTYNLQDGVLDLQNHNISIGPGTGAFNMTGGTLKNANTIAFALNQTGGTLAPGASPGTTTIQGSYTLGAAGILDIDLNGPNAGTDFDQVIMTTGTLSLAGNLLAHVGFTPALGSQFEIIDNQGANPVLGQFANAPGGIYSVGAIQFSVNYAGGDGNDVVLTTTAVPEPSILCLSGLAFAGLMGLRPSRRVNRNA